MRYLRESGDTIVEVLIAIAIVSMILGGAFASSQRSFNVNQRTQERGEATKYVEQQLERLKAASNSPTASTTGIFRTSVPAVFCLDTAASIVTAGCTTGPGNRYTLEIRRGVDNKTFTVSTVWDQSGGRGQDRVVMVYRVYPS